MSTKKPKPKRGLFAFSADPITEGHLEVIERASVSCEHLIVAVMNNPDKASKYLFRADERLKIARKAIAARGFGNVSVIADDGLLTDLYLREGCDRFYRGVRNSTDFGYERDQIAALELILPDFANDADMVVTSHWYGHISSTLVKQFASYFAAPSGLVPMFVQAELQKRIGRQTRIGVTGGIAVGKSTVSASLASTFDNGHHVNVDELVRALYAEKTPGAQQVRDGLEKILGRGVLTPDRRDVDRSVMAERFFDPNTGEKIRDEITKLTSPHVDRLYRAALKGKTGVVIVEWAQMAEMAMSHWACHRVIVVDSPDRERFAAKRGIAPEQLARVRAKQWPADRKAAALQAAADEAGYGWVLPWQNRWRDDEAARAADTLSLHDQILARIDEPNF